MTIFLSSTQRWKKPRRWGRRFFKAEWNRIKDDIERP